MITKACPECGCEQYVNKNLVGDGYRECRSCGQEWWTDIEYRKDKPMKILLEQLENIVISSSLGNGIEPVWDGNCISKTAKGLLSKMKFIEKIHGYYFPTDLGIAVHKTFNTNGCPFALSDYGYAKFLEGKESINRNEQTHI